MRASGSKYPVGLDVSGLVGQASGDAVLKSVNVLREAR